MLAYHLQKRYYNLAADVVLSFGVDVVSQPYDNKHGYDGYFTKSLPIEQTSEAILSPKRAF
jgi:hypothetical protein